MTSTLIFSVESLMNESLSASILPSVSPLTMMLSSLNEPRAMRWLMSESVRRFCVRRPCSRWSCRRLLAMSRASCSVSRTWNVSPAVARRQTEDDGRLGRSCALYAAVTLVEHGLDTSVVGTGDDVVAHSQRTVRHEYGGNISTSLVE